MARSTAVSSAAPPAWHHRFVTFVLAHDGMSPRQGSKVRSTNMERMAASALHLLWRRFSQTTQNLGNRHKTNKLRKKKSHLEGHQEHRSAQQQCQAGKQILGSAATARVWCGALATKQCLLLVRADGSSSHWWLGQCHQPELVSVSVSPLPTALPGHPDWAALIAAWLLLVSIKTTQITAPLKTLS